MGFTPFEFDESVAQTEPGRPHVPDGYYKFRAVKVEPTPEDYQKTTGVLITVAFVEGPDHAPGAGVGREMNDFSALAGKKTSDGRGTQFGLGQTLGAFGMASVAKKLPGIKINSYPEFQNLCARLTAAIAGKEAVGLVANQAGTNGREFSGVEEWLPVDEWATLKHTTTSTAVGPRATATVAPAAPLNGPVTQSVRSAVDDLFT